MRNIPENQSIINSSLTQYESGFVDDGKTQPKKTRKRTVSGDASFPYNDLDQAIAVPRAIHQNLGSRGITSQVSGALGLKGGALARRIGAAKLFGLVERQGLDLVITDLGRKAISVEESSSAKVEAFLNVEVFKLTYEHFKNSSLPADKGLSNFFVQCGVPEGVSDIARAVFKKSARQAGFFNFGEDRLIIPPSFVGDQGAQDVPPTGGSSGNERPLVGGDPMQKDTRLIEKLNNIHQSLIGMIGDIPDKGEVWPEEEFSVWLSTFEQTMRYAYKIRGS